jgi:hypothetical protein
VNNVATKAQVSNDGIANLMVCDGAMSVCTTGTVLINGSKAIANAPAITVTNMSPAENGSFSVKVEVV